MDVKRLCESIAYSRRVLEPFRTERREAVREYAGRHWTGDNLQKKVPLNLIALYVQIVGRNLIAKNPRAMLSTMKRAHAPMVDAMQAWVNDAIVQMDLAAVLQEAVTDAMFSIGIVKVGLATPGDAALGGWSTKAGTPFAASVDLDDFVFDARAKKFSEVAYIGNRVRVPLDTVRDSKRYSSKRKELTASESFKENNEQGDERIEQLGRAWEGGNDTEFEDMVDLWEIYLPRRRQIITLACEDNGVPRGDWEPLSEQEWIGPDEGPFHILGFGKVPGNAMPLAPIQNLIDLHMIVNELYRKLMRQASRQKQLTLIKDNASQDGKNIVEESDGGTCRVNNPENVVPYESGGPNANNFQFSEHARNMFSWAAGNLDAMGGLSPQAKTATQDKMLAEGANKGVADMQETSVTFSSEVVRSLCWFWHHDPFTTMKTNYADPRAPEYSITRKVAPAQRQQLRFEDLGVRVDPYSLQHSTPQARAGALNQIVQGIVLPAMPILQQQGIGFDLGAFLKKLGEYFDMPDLPDILTYQDPPQPEAPPTPGGGDMPTMPRQTERKYVRENRSERTQQGNSMMLQNMLRGMDSGGAGRQRPQQAQTFGMAR